MSELNSTDDDRLNARVDAILASAFPLADSPDFPIGPLPLWKVRSLLVEGYRARGDDPERADDPEPAVADILRENDAEKMLCQIGAIFSAIDAMANDRDSQFDAESAQWLVTLGRELVRRLLPAGDAP